MSAKQEYINFRDEFIDRWMSFLSIDIDNYKFVMLFIGKAIHYIIELENENERLKSIIEDMQSNDE